jgi:hypothetical protein
VESAQSLAKGYAKNLLSDVAAALLDPTLSRTAPWAPTMAKKKSAKKAPQNKSAKNAPISKSVQYTVKKTKPQPGPMRGLGGGKIHRVAAEEPLFMIYSDSVNVAGIRFLIKPWLINGLSPFAALYAKYRFMRVAFRIEGMMNSTVSGLVATGIDYLGWGKPTDPGMGLNDLIRLPGARIVKVSDSTTPWIHVESARLGGWLHTNIFSDDDHTGSEFSLMTAYQGPLETNPVALVSIKYMVEFTESVPTTGNLQPLASRPVAPLQPVAPLRPVAPEDPVEGIQPPPEKPGPLVPVNEFRAERSMTAGRQPPLDLMAVSTDVELPENITAGDIASMIMLLHVQLPGKKILVASNKRVLVKGWDLLRPEKPKETPHRPKQPEIKPIKEKPVERPIKASELEYRSTTWVFEKPMGMTLTPQQHGLLESEYKKPVPSVIWITQAVIGNPIFSQVAVTLYFDAGKSNGPYEALFPKDTFFTEEEMTKYGGVGHDSTHDGEFQSAETPKKKEKGKGKHKGPQPDHPSQAVTPASGRIRYIFDLDDPFVLKLGPKEVEELSTKHKVNVQTLYSSSVTDEGTGEERLQNFVVSVDKDFASTFQLVRRGKACVPRKELRDRSVYNDDDEDDGNGSGDERHSE